MVEVNILVLTLRDPVCEADEYFRATLILEQTPLLVDIGPDTAFVSITDATGKCVYIKQCVFIVHQSSVKPPTI